MEQWVLRKLTGGGVLEGVRRLTAEANADVGNVKGVSLVMGVEVCSMVGVRGTVGNWDGGEEEMKMAMELGERLNMKGHLVGAVGDRGWVKVEVGGSEGGEWLEFEG
ncbi:hypothetical protein RYX36_014757 [Vicia faba]